MIHTNLLGSVNVFRVMQMDGSLSDIEGVGLLSVTLAMGKSFPLVKRDG